MTWGEVGGQAPQGRDTEAGQRKSRLSVQLDLILVKEAPPASAVGSRSRIQLNPNGNGHTEAENKEAGAYKGGGLSEGATHGSLPSSASYSQTPLVAQSTIHRSRQGWSLGGSLNDVHPAVGRTIVLLLGQTQKADKLFAGPSLLWPRLPTGLPTASSAGSWPGPRTISTRDFVPNTLHTQGPEVGTKILEAFPVTCANHSPALWHPVVLLSNTLCAGAMGPT